VDGDSEKNGESGTPGDRRTADTSFPSVYDETLLACHGFAASVFNPATWLQE
jgi:hypothetical protein